MQNYVDMMAKNAVAVFYAGGGKLRTVTVIANMSAQPSPGNYYGPPGVRALSAIGTIGTTAANVQRSELT
jgi:hypothetical protein